ncbi:MAG: phosphatase PAP2 family protein [bacterium]|nr:phosphatase PAP2 family protein [bacterium]
MDKYLFDFINQFVFRWHWLDALGIFFAGYFQYAVAVSLLLFLAVNFKKYWKAVSLAAFSAIFARVFIELIYFICPKTRPFGVIEVNQLVSHSVENAFPSGHATFFFALATIIFLYNKKAGMLYFLFAFLISLARVFAGIHWPLDILAGAIIGILIALILNKIYNQVFDTRC